LVGAKGLKLGEDAHPDIALALIEVVAVGVEGWGDVEATTGGEEVVEPAAAEGRVHGNGDELGELGGEEFIGFFSSAD
jgi:hypothetical protein